MPTHASKQFTYLIGYFTHDHTGRIDVTLPRPIVSPADIPAVESMLGDRFGTRVLVTAFSLYPGINGGA